VAVPWPERVTVTEFVGTVMRYWAATASALIAALKTRATPTLTGAYCSTAPDPLRSAPRLQPLDDGVGTVSVPAAAPEFTSWPLR
jgi:hypothetical protein